jgi:hypothetical protein
LSDLYKEKPQWAWLFPVPGMGFQDIFSQQRVVLLGVAYFVLFGLFVVSLLRYFHSTQPILYLIKSSSFFVVLILVFLVFCFRGIGLEDLLSQFYISSLNEFILVQEQAGLPMDKLDYIRGLTPQLAQALIVLSPAFCFISVLSVLLINLILIKRFFGFLIPAEKQEVLNNWQLSFGAVWGVIAALGFVVGNYYGLTATNPFLPYASNILLIMSFLYWIQGLSIMSFYFDKRGFQILTRVLVFSLLFMFFQVSVAMLTTLGFFDSWFDFRKIQKKTA